MKALTLLLISLCGHADFRTRESATVALDLTCRCSRAAYHSLPESHPDPEVRHRLALVRETCYWCHPPALVAELIATPWHFNRESGEGGNNMRFRFFPDGTLAYYSGGIPQPATGNSGLCWSLWRDTLQVRGAFNEDYQRQPDGTWRMTSRDVVISRNR